VKLDCGGAKCGYNSSDCSSSEQDSESESEEEYRARVRKEKERQLEKARSGVKTDRHGKPVSSGSGHSSGRRR
jgi:hypothetical protein